MAQLFIFGKVGTAPEERTVKEDLKLTSFSVSCRDSTSRENKYFWVRVTCWGDRFKNVLSKITKGDKVVVVGDLKAPTTYTTRDGITAVSLEVTALSITVDWASKDSPNLPAGDTGTPKTEWGAEEIPF